MFIVLKCFWFTLQSMVKAADMKKSHAKAFTHSGNTKPLSVKYDYAMPGDGKLTGVEVVDIVALYHLCKHF